MDADEYRTVYLDQNPRCEICKPARLYARRHDACEVHHIAHAGKRFEFWGNYLSVCRVGHDWIHANPRLGIILCWLVKAGKDELDHVEFNLTIGKSLWAWAHRMEVPLSWEWKKLELLAVLKSKGADSPFMHQ